MKEGVFYYQNLFKNMTNTFEDIKEAVLNDLQESLKTLQNFGEEIENILPIPATS